jgi:hypothetical protein
MPHSCPRTYSKTDRPELRWTCAALLARVFPSSGSGPKAAHTKGSKAIERKAPVMSTEAIVVIVVLVLLFGGGGYYWRRRG